MTNKQITAAILSLGFAAAAGAAPPERPLLEPIHAFMETFNHGDTRGAAATHNPAGAVIVDEVPPFLWRGPGAFAGWMRDLAANDRRAGITQEHVTLSPPTRIERSGARAYVVMPAFYSFRRHGTAMRERAQMTFALERGAAGWMIDGWTWTGPRASPAQ